ncbi:MAG: FitA-like ribbon-helix-helix domain-containing protein [Acidimicrobiales bacterium]
MPRIQVKDVPTETHAVLSRRAVEAHQALQEYLLGRLIEKAATPTVEEIVERAGGRGGGSVSFSDALTALAEDRGRR